MCNFWRSAVILLTSFALMPPSAARAQDRLPDVAANDDVQRHIEGFEGRGAVGDPDLKPLSPEDSLDTFELTDGLALETVLHEPVVRQPVFLNFDERGRMWVVQYLQYPFPAGLKVVKYDQYLRAVFDKVPPPPPNHFRGADKITIHEDTDGDGRFDKHKTFIDGLNIATSVTRGRGGVWVLNPPYLLFYPDRDNDDVPDGDPEVHLAGFGLEDTHSVTNSLRWGPDGWLYAAHGSTVTATVRRPGIDAEGEGVHFKGQGIWRYHPETRRFELFAEGGGNTFGVEFDAAGRVYSGHNGGNTRGFHYVQGGYYLKNWGKHGPLTNPYAFGFFPEMQHADVERFSHTFVVYDAAALPERFHGRLVAPVPLHHYIALAEITPDGSTFRTEDLEQCVTTSDGWFRPVDIKLGPDGAIYVADWYDTRLTHVDPRDTWDRAHGRIYRLRSADAQPHEPFNLAERTSDELVDLLSHPNKWHRQTALRLLGDRRDASVIPRLRRLLAEDDGQLALEALWALNLSGGFDRSIALAGLDHANPHVRLWTIRLIGDARSSVDPVLAERLTDLARDETDLEVRSQLASAAKRLHGQPGLPIAAGLLQRPADAEDPHLPLLTWWAVEAHVATDLDRLMRQFTEQSAWDSPVASETILPRLARRLAADPTDANQQALARLLNSAPDAEQRRILAQGVNEAFQGREIADLSSELSEALRKAVGTDGKEPWQVAIRLRSGDANAHAQVLDLVRNDDPRLKPQRIAYLELLGQVGRPSAVPVLLEVARASQWHSVRRAALGALRRFDVPDIGTRIIELYDQLPTDQRVRETAVDVLSSRRGWALALVSAVDRGDIHRSAVAADVRQRLLLHEDAQIAELVTKLWGRTRPTPQEFHDRVAQVADILARGEGDPLPGRELFTQHCAKCHKLHGQGEDLGPDLTGYERDNLDYMLLSTVDPSAAIREEFTSFQLVTVDGLVLTGFVKQRGDQTITLATAEKGEIVIPNDEIDEGPTAMSISLMPDRLLDELSDQQIRDLFAYLRSSAGLAPGSQETNAARE